MFALDTHQVPATVAELSAVIERSVRRIVSLSKPEPILIDGELPKLSAVTVNLTGSVVSDETPPTSAAVGPVEDGPTVESLRVFAAPINARGVSAELEVNAAGVVFAHGKSADGRVVVTVKSAVDGSVRFRIVKRELEAAILAAAKTATASAGVAVQAVDVNLTSVGPRTVDVLLSITVKKFVTAVIRVSGRLAVDDQMVATATGLKVDGDGIAGSVAAGFIRPQLQKINGQNLSLFQFSIGDLRLRDVAVSTAGGLQIDASFGGPA
jgi:hypothetical protein